MLSSNFKCFCCCVIKFFLFCLLIVLPMVGLVWWFVTKPPFQFMLTCFGMGIAWSGMGVAYYFYRYSSGKYKQLTK